MPRGRPKGSKIDTGALTYDQWYYQTVRQHRPRPTRRKEPKARCSFCEIFLVSKYAGSPQNRKYCTSCKESKSIKKKLTRMYNARAHAKAAPPKAKTTWFRKSPYKPKYQEQYTDPYKHLEALGV
jgi:hypothetical protein